MRVPRSGFARSTGASLMRVRDWPVTGACLLDADGRVLDADLAIGGLLQVDRAALVRRPLDEHLVPEDGVAMPVRLQALADHGSETFAAAARDIAPAARRFLVSLSVFRAGRDRRIGAFVREIAPTTDADTGAAGTGTVSASEGDRSLETGPSEADWRGILLREIDARFRAAFENSGDSMAIVRSSDGFILDANAALGTLLGYTREELIGHTTVALGVSSDDPGFRPAMLTQLQERGSVRDMPMLARTKTGERRETLHSAFKIEGTHVPTHVAIIRDVTEQRRHERALAESEAKFAAAFRGSVEAMIISRIEDSLILDVNDAYLRLTGYGRDELIGQSALRLGLIPDPAGRLQRVEETRARGELRDAPTPVRTRSGEIRDCLQTGFLVTLDGRAAGVSILRDMTDAKRRERALAESEAKFSAAFHGSVEAMIISRLADGLILDVNGAYLDLTGYSRDELIGRTTLAVGTIADPEGRRQRVEQTRAAGWLRDAPSPTRTRSGEIRDCLQTSFLVTIGGEEAWVSILRDMTEARRAERLLRESEARFSAAFHGSPDAMVVTRQRDGVVVDMNAAHERLTGYSRSYLVGRSPLEMGIVVDLELRTWLVEQVQSKGGVRDVEFPIRRPTDEIRACLQSSFAVDLEGEACMVSILRDVTDSRLAELALRQSEARLSQAVRVADIGIFEHDHLTDTMYWSAEQRRIFGFSPDEVVTVDKILAMILPSDVERARRDIARAHDPRGDGKYDTEKRIRRRDGEIRWLATRAETSFEGVGAQRRPVRTVGAVMDITERRLSEEAIRRSEALLAEAQRTAHLGNFERDFVTGRARWSDEVYRLLGCEPGAYPAAFQTLTRFTHPDDRAALEAEYARAFDPDLGGFFETEHRIVTPEGEVRTLHQRAQVTFDEIGRPVRIFGTSQDVTERRQLESELRRLNQELEHRVAARTAELEQVNRDLESFSYSVSHDLRAPLRHVQGYIAMFERSLRVPLDADAQARLAVIGEAARRMGTLIDSLLAFSRIGRAAMHYCTVELDTLIREVISELEPDTEGREIAWNIEPLPKVMADRNLLRLVLTNLVSNALKFTRGRPSARIDIGSAVVAGERIFRIHDNGVGFDMQYVHKLFGVFQRLHSASDFPGTGIGLAHCRRIIERHGGRIWIESEEGVGTTVRFTLPELPAVAS